MLLLRAGAALRCFPLPVPTADPASSDGRLGDLQVLVGTCHPDPPKRGRKPQAPLVRGGLATPPASGGMCGGAPPSLGGRPRTATQHLPPAIATRCPHHRHLRYATIVPPLYSSQQPPQPPETRQPPLPTTSHSASSPLRHLRTPLYACQLPPPRRHRAPLYASQSTTNATPPPRPPLRLPANNNCGHPTTPHDQQTSGPPTRTFLPTVSVPLL